MRIFKNCEEAIREVEREMWEFAEDVQVERMQDIEVKNNDDYKTKELIAYCFSVVDTKDKDKMFEYMKSDNLEWCKKEIWERTKETANPGEAWEIRKEIWEPFLKKHVGKFAYFYSERMYSQIKRVIEELKKNPNTRQGIIAVYDRQTDHTRIGNDRIPCSMFYHLLYRNGKLNIIYNMRSSDFLTHFINDAWLAISLRDYIADKVGMEKGTFTFFSSSLHAYYKDLKIRGIF